MLVAVAAARGVLQQDGVDLASAARPEAGAADHLRHPDRRSPGRERAQGSSHPQVAGGARALALTGWEP
jgi:hypothetical protein